MLKDAHDRPHSSTLRGGRFSAPGLAYFITTTVEQRRPLLNPAVRETVIQSLLWAREQGHIWLLGYVIMDDHFHVLVVLRGETSLAQFMRGLKRHTAREANRLWSQKGQFWQEGYHDHAIRDEPDLSQHIRYTYANPMWRGWVTKPEDCQWSSAHASRQQDLDWDNLE